MSERLPHDIERQLRADSFHTIATLSGVQVLAVFALGAFNQRIVRLTDNAFGKTKVGLFRIEEVNGQEPDFSDYTRWQQLELESIRFSLTFLTPFGQGTDTYRKLTHINSIELLEPTQD